MSVSPKQLQGLLKEIPYKMRKGPGGKSLAYIDARQAMDLLDEILSPENWQCDYKEVSGNVYCGIGIFINEQWVWKWDCGAESNIEAEKGESSDAFKRAAVRWGVGRFLYSIVPGSTQKNQTAISSQPQQRPIGNAQAKEAQKKSEPISFNKSSLIRDIKSKINTLVKSGVPATALQSQMKKKTGCLKTDDLSSASELELLAFEEVLDKWEVA